MKYLADINLLLPLLVTPHVNESAAWKWFGKVGKSEVGLRRLTQLGALRLLCNQVVMQDDVLSPLKAWELLETLLNDERVVFLPEPVDLDIALASLLDSQLRSPNLWTDAYLAAFSIASGLQMVTFDRDFKRFSGLDYLLLTNARS